MMVTGLSLLSAVALALAPSIRSQSERDLSSVNRLLLTAPGHFAVRLHTEGHPEDRPVSPLPFPVVDVERELVRALRKAGVRLEPEAGEAAAARPLSLSLHVWLDSGVYSYVVDLVPGDLPDDPKDRPYEYIWPASAGQAERAKLRTELLQKTRGLAVEFGLLCRRARERP